MIRTDRRLLKFVLILAFALAALRTAGTAAGPSLSGGELTVLGKVTNTQGIPVENARVRVSTDGKPAFFKEDGERVDSLSTNQEGLFLGDVDLEGREHVPEQITLTINKESFRTEQVEFSAGELTCGAGQCYARTGDVVLHRILNAAFFLASGIFIIVFGMISFNLVHETIATFLGSAAMLGVSYFLGSSQPQYWIIGFHNAIEFIDFEVIFLLLAMMIFMAIMSQTGVFRWLAYRTFRVGKGNNFIIALILILITGFTSAVLNDTTVMLLMTPISIQIALALKIRPEAIVIPEILASNIGGAATLIGTPPNTIIGSYVGLGFNQMLVNMLPISLLSMGVLILMTRRLFQDQFFRDSSTISEALQDELAKTSQITDKPLLTKSLILFGITMILFFIEDLFHMPPAVVALIGASSLLLWVQPNISEMLKEVDWTTLVFFMTLFMMVGGIQKVGLIQLIAESVQQIAGGNLLLATLLIIWVSAFASAIVANIPFTVAIVPVTVFLTSRIPGAENNILYWALAVGAGLGGNATYIGSAPNIVAAGIMDRAGYRMSFADFSRIGVPITFATLLISTLWILARYLWLGS